MRPIKTLDATGLLWRLLNHKSRRQLVVLLFMTLVSGFVELLTVGLIIPFVAMASGSLPFGRANFLTDKIIGAIRLFGVSEEHTTAALGLVFLAGIAVANLYLCGYQYYAAYVLSVQRHDMSLRVIKNVANQPISWLETRNSSDLMKIALDDVTQASSFANALVQLVGVLARCSVVYGFLLITQFRLAVGTAISLLILYQIVFRYVQQPITRAGTTAQSARAAMYRIASELTGGSRTVRATVTEDHFLEKFERNSLDYVYPQVIRTMPGYATRAGLETATVAIVVGFLIYFNAKDGSLANGLPLLSSYAVAGIRLLPSVQQAANYLLDFRYFTPSLYAVADLLENEQPDSPPSKASCSSHKLERCLTLQHVSYSYNDHTSALNDINLTIRKNERIAFVGSTGAGKSTMVDIILALRFPISGKMLIDDIQVTEATARAWRRQVGYVPQQIYLLDDTITANVAFGIPGGQVDLARVEAACEAASIREFIHTLPEGFDTSVGERGVRLSGGQMQRLAIARALYHEPDVVVFDEATSALDSATEASVLEALQGLAGKKTLVAIAHRINTIWDFDRIVVLKEGRIISEGTASELMQSCEVFKRLAQQKQDTDPL